MSYQGNILQLTIKINSIKDLSNIQPITLLWELPVYLFIHSLWMSIKKGGLTVA